MEKKTSWVKKQKRKRKEAESRGKTESRISGVKTKQEANELSIGQENRQQLGRISSFFFFFFKELSGKH